MSDLHVNYDEIHDVLYISIGTPMPSYSEEKTSGFIVRKSFVDDTITGVTILDFKERLASGSTITPFLPFPVDVGDIAKTLHIH